MNEMFACTQLYPIGATTASTTTKTIPSRAIPDLRHDEGIRLPHELVCVM